MAGVSIRSKGLLPAVGVPLQLPAQTQPTAQVCSHGRYAEHVVGADRHARLLAFAAIPVDNGLDGPGRLDTLCFLNSHRNIPL